MNYKKVNTNEAHTEYNIVLVYDNGKEQIVSKSQDLYTAWLAQGNTPEEVAYVAPEPSPEPPVKEITKLTIVDRLIAIDKLSDALTVIESNATQKARWDAAMYIKIDDADVIAVLTAIGVDSSAILY